MEDGSIKINKGSILIYRVFDLGEEVNLHKVEEILATTFNNKSRLKFAKDPKKSIILSDAPISINIGEISLKIGSRDVISYVSAKMWNYGALSLSFQVPIPEGTEWEKLISISSEIDTAIDIDVKAAEQAQKIYSIIGPAIKLADLWNTVEDYTIYYLEKVSGVEVNKALSLLDKVDVPSLILAETKEELSDSSSKFILDSVKQYSKNDLVVMDWNSALIYDPSGQKDVVDVIEFSLTHLLEMRYYDDLLEQKLNRLYDSIEEKSQSKIFSDLYSNLAQEASKTYIEVSEFLERVDNSLKTVGDFYLANIFRHANNKFRFEDWKKSVDRKMKNLAQISELLQAEVDTKRSHYLEIIIILLIAGEILAAIPWSKLF